MNELDDDDEDAYSTVYTQLNKLHGCNKVVTAGSGGSDK